MARNRGKKALYEVMSKGKARQGYGKTLEHIHRRKTEEFESGAARPKARAQLAKAAPDWWRKPRIVQFNAGRFEFSMPYQIAIALGLVVVLALLASYRLGQNSVASGQMAAGTPVRETENTSDPNSGVVAMANTPEPALPVEYVLPKQDAPTNEDVSPVVEAKDVEPAKPKGDHVIVLVQFGRYADLVPVQEHFAEHEIQTEIRQRGGQYFLETTDRYDSPARPGTDGFKAKLEIMRVGLLYKNKAPAGLEAFERHLFQDVYGRKVEN